MMLTFNEIEQLDKSLLGIYVIHNDTSGRIYLGSTVESFRRRLLHHRWCLRNGQHKNTHLQNSYNKHGEDAFRICLLEVIESADQVHKREQLYFDSFKEEWDRFYNIDSTVQSPPTGPEVAAARSRAMKEKWSDPTYREKMRGRTPWNKGGTFTNESREKMSKAASNRSPESRISQREAMKKVARQVVMTDLDGNVLDVATAVELAEKHALVVTPIRSVCNGHYSTDSYRGFRFSYQ